MAALTPTIGIANEIARMDRQRLVQELLGFRGRIRLDFTPEFLTTKSVDWLRHVLLAACLKAK